MNEDIIILQRDVEAVLVPSAARVKLVQGTEVTMTQALGSSITVNVYGNLARIDGHDADALGREIDMEVMKDGPTEGPLEERVWSQLRLCYDPEIPVNLVDLGLIYDCRIEPTKRRSHTVYIDMTLTAPGCNMGPVIVNDVQNKLMALPDVNDVKIELVFDPPWDQSRMSEGAKLALGMI